MAELQPSLLKETSALIVAPGAPFCLFELSGPPRGKAAKSTTIGWTADRKPYVKVYVDGDTQNYMDAIGWAAKGAMKGRAPTRNPVCIVLHAFFTIPKSWNRRDRDDALLGVIRPTGKPDWDNIAKGACDGMTGVVWEDDAPIVDGRVIKLYSDDPALRVEVREFVPPT